MKNMRVVDEPSPTSSPKSDSSTKALSNKLPVDDAARMEVDEVKRAFKTDFVIGLSDNEVSLRRKETGPNEIKDEDDETLLSKFLDKFREPMILLLLGSALISVLLKQYDDAASITLAVIIVCTVGFVQEWRSDKALQELKTLTRHKATVCRDGVLKEVEATELVIGDIVQLNVGDRVPADIRLIEAVRLGIEESIFTGEVNAASKTTRALTTTSPPSPIGNVDEERFPKAVHVHELKNIAFMGTLVANGNAKGVVVNIGSETELGKIATLLNELGDRKTPLQDAMEALSEQISKYSFAIVAIIFLIGVVTGKSWLEMFTMGISLAVAAIPEGLPIVVTVTLAMGVIRMARKNAIVRKLPSVESLGACNVICVDKTGTLTKNEMTVVKAFTFADQNSILDVEGIGYQTQVRGFKVYSRDYGVRATIQEQHKRSVDPSREAHLRQLFTTGALCNNANLSPDHKLVGQPTEGALLAVAIKAGINREQLLREDWEREDEIPFSSEEKWMAVHCKNKHTNQRIYFMKGALEAILPRCSHYYVNEDDIRTLSQLDKQKISSVATEFADNALRVMTLAYGDDIKGGLTFVGLMGLFDPPRDGVQAAIEKLRKAGVKVVMITGDSKETAIAIAKQLSIIDNDERDVDSVALTVADLQDEKTFDTRVEKAAVYYRMAPVHKMKIVEAYQKLHYVVAMTGDGVNDAPALKLANIGIAMGKTGTDVSKEASEMILADDNFPTIMVAIEEGKSIFSNIKNFLRYQLTTSVSCMVIIIICTFLGLPLPLNPMQILWINIIMDGPPAQSLGVEPVDEDVMKQPPRDTKKSIISQRMVFSILFSSVIMVIGTMYVFLREMELDGRVTSRDTTMTFTTFVMFQIFNAFNCRSEKKSVFQIGLFKNVAFNFCIGGCVLGQLALIYGGWMNFIFETERLSLNDIIFIFALTSSVWILDEIVKIFFRNKDKTIVAVKNTEYGKKE
jgi:Ca2+-transporting ATPase